MFESQSLSQQKAALRVAMKARRGAMSEVERSHASRAICRRLSNWLDARPEKTVGVYLAASPEISLDGLIGWLLERGTLVAAPRVDRKQQSMAFWRLRALKEVETGPFNLRQPPARESVADVPLVLVPGLAFDEKGGRLGMGGGWYDRTLNESQIAVGVGFDWQIVDGVPLEAIDQKVRFVCSERRWVEVSPQQGHP